MSVLLIEPVYAGPVSYYRSLTRAEHVLFDVHAHYQKRTFRNRCAILGANGKLTLSIPLLHGKGQKQPMKEVRISYAENWQKDHWMSLTSAYRRAPFFEFYEDSFRPFYEKKWDLLADFDLEYTDRLQSVLKLPYSHTISEAYKARQAFDGVDLREQYLPQHPLEVKSYLQVFSDRLDFMPDLSILDALFNLGPGTRDYLRA